MTKQMKAWLRFVSAGTNKPIRLFRKISLQPPRTNVQHTGTETGKMDSPRHTMPTTAPRNSICMQLRFFLFIDSLFQPSLGWALGSFFARVVGRWGLNRTGLRQCLIGR